MRYDIEQLTIESNGLRQTRDNTLQQYHQLCGALTLVEQMVKCLQDDEKLEKEKCEADSASVEVAA